MNIDLKDHCYAMVDSLDKNLMEGWRSSSLENKTVMTKPWCQPSRLWSLASSGADSKILMQLLKTDYFIQESVVQVHKISIILLAQ